MEKTRMLLLLVLISMSYGAVSSVFIPQLNVFRRFNANDVTLDLCPTCMNEALELIDTILNIILDEGVVRSCGELCSDVYNKTSSKVLADLCLAGCDAVGIDEFLKIVVAADIDPIYYCELIDLCPIKDDGDAKFTNFGVYPKTGPEGATFTIDLSFKTINGTGTGTFDFTLINPKNESDGAEYWFEAKKPGTYTERIQFETLIFSRCDPSKGEICEDWPLGVYNITARICNGMCDSHHPHTSLYDIQRSSFNITKKQ